MYITLNFIILIISIVFITISLCFVLLENLIVNLLCDGRFILIFMELTVFFLVLLILTFSDYTIPYSIQLEQLSILSVENTIESTAIDAPSFNNSAQNGKNNAEDDDNYAYWLIAAGIVHILWFGYFGRPVPDIPRVQR